MIFAFIGEEIFLRNRALEKYFQERVTPAVRDLNLETFEGSEVSAIRIMESALQFPAFAERRVLRIHRAHEIKKAELDRLTTFLPDIPDTTDLVLVADKADARMSFWQKLKALPPKMAILKEFKPLYLRDIPRWIMEETRSDGFLIHTDAAQWLSTVLGTDLSLLHSALQKIYLLKGSENKADKTSKNITMSDVESCVTTLSWKSVFELIDAVAQKNLKKALKLFQVMVSSGESPVGMVSILARHFRILSKVREGDVSGIAPFFLKDYQRQAQAMSQETLEGKREAIFQTDRALKSVPLPTSLVFESLLIDLCRS